ncbi:hypothetical protein BPTFM16_01812 [Altererythrobacter insulae]|nr:hypothetical protein BPTFM16_01812 [Altererythrobacter insulae]
MPTKPQFDVSILVVGFNSARFIERCFDAIERAVLGFHAQVLFINNGSDNSEAIIAEAFPWVEIIKSRGNVGFAAANNLLARHSSGEHLLLLNPDTAIDADAVSKLVDAAQMRPSFGILSGTTFIDSGGGAVLPMLTLPATGTLLRNLFPARELPTPYGKSEVVEVEAVSGGFMFVRRDVWTALGGLDEQYFLYAEDLDFCHRAHQIGAKVGLVPNAEIRHTVGSGDQFSPERLRYKAKGDATYVRNHFSPIRAALNLFLMWLGFTIRWKAALLFSPFSKSRRERLWALAPLVFAPRRWMTGYPS